MKINKLVGNDLIRQRKGSLHLLKAQPTNYCYPSKHGGLILQICYPSKLLLSHKSSTTKLYVFLLAVNVGNVL